MKVELKVWPDVDIWQWHMSVDGEFFSSGYHADYLGGCRCGIRLPGEPDARGTS